MDDMDIDSVLDVPDTPDRLTAQTDKGKRSMERESNLSASGHLGHCNRFVDDTRNGLKFSDKGKRKLLIHAPKSVLSSSKCDSHSNLVFASGNSSSSSANNSLIFRRVPGETPNYENKHFQPTEDNKRLHTQSSAVHVVDLTEQNGHVQVGKRDYPCKVRGNSRAEGYGKNPPLTSRLPSSCGMSNSSVTSCCANKGKGPNDTAPGFDCDDVIGSLAETQPKAGKAVPTSLNSVSSPRITGQKRLVRNGCISPHNIAKTKQVGIDKNGDIDVGPNHSLPMVSIAPPIGVGVSESITEDIDSHKSKGKGVMMTHPLSVKESDALNTHARNSVSAHDIVKEVGDNNKDRFGSLEEFGGWRSTHNRSKKMNLPMADEHQHLSSEKDDPHLAIRLPGNGVTGRKIQSSAGTTNNFPMDQDSTSSQSAPLPPRRHRASNLRPQHQFKGHQAARNMLGKRQKQGSFSSSHGESSVAALDDSDIVFLGSSGNTSTSSSTQTRSRNGLAILDPVIEIEEASPEDRGEGSSAAGGSSTATDAMARQIEADEMLARELQEQFYNEVPSAVVGEEDMHVAMALQHEESLTRAFPRRSQHLLSPTCSFIPTSTRQSQPRSSLNLSRRSTHARGPTLSRMARLRSRFPGRPRTISSSSSSSSSRERNSLFPPDMDVDMRMYILEALEAFSDMGVDNNFLQTQREFNENDYEMLLALDENNHQHGGATDRQINGLPESTVQIDNLEEACAICLETPNIGDMIRHLPCLHKFHKDCIDPWLRRRTSCPVCKSSIT